ncbi:hypothetical protein NTGHW29_320007 [Candidatus Nitrotoga sp. HW29]|nr:hypothetical protein NTGHW29_320007 [Candidatus Nitrotoga sp. HW29]
MGGSTTGWGRDTTGGLGNEEQAVKNTLSTKTNHVLFISI